MGRESSKFKVFEVVNFEEAAMEGEKEKDRKRKEEQTNHGWFFIKINDHLTEKT